MAEMRLTRRERERLWHKEAILEVALRLFSRKGFHNVSMQQIAEASEFAVGTLYNFFDSKEALFEEMAESCAQRIIADLLAVLDGPGSEREHLASLIRLQPKILAEHAEFIRMYVSEVGLREAGPSRVSASDDFDSVLNAKLAQLVASGIEKGMFRRVDPLITAKAIVSLMRTLGFEIAGRFDRNEVTETFAKVERLFLDGLLLPKGATE